MQEFENNYYLGLDIGGTKCAIVVGDKRFNVKQRIQFETRAKERNYTDILEEFFLHIEELFREFPRQQLAGIGISCGGPLDSHKGMIYSPPNLPGWDNVPIIDIFSKKYAVPVALQNDANACALAEWLMGAGTGTRNMIFLTFGTGMGGGLILDGHLYTGTNDLAGEVGHIRLAEDGPVGYGKAGSFEGFCSGGGIAQLAQSFVSEKLKKGEHVEFCSSMEEVKELDAKKVALAAGKGDPIANEIIRISAEKLGKGLAVLIDLINPECIVIGSIYARNEDLFKPHMDRILKEEAIPSALKVCRIKPALLGDSIGDYAALCVALYENKF